MPAMATDIQEFMAITNQTPAAPGEYLGVKEYYKGTGTPQSTRRYRQLGRASIEQEVIVGASSSTPTIAAGAQGSAASMVAGSSDAVGSFNITCTVTPGVNCTITFGTALPAAPRAVMVTTVSGGVGTWGVTSTASTFVLTSLTAPAAAAYVFQYLVIP